MPCKRTILKRSYLCVKCHFLFQFVHVQVIVTAIKDAFPEKFRNRQTLITGIICFFSFILGILCVTEVRDVGRFNKGANWIT